MKLRIVLSLAAVLFLSEIALFAHSKTSVARNQEGYTGSAQIEARFTDVDFVPDGATRARYWKRARWTSFDRNAKGTDRYPESKTGVAVLWSGKYLYIAFRSPYSTLNTYHGEDPAIERWELWNRDVVEVFLNPQPDRLSHYYEFEVAPNNQWLDLEIELDNGKSPVHDASWNSGFQHATQIDAQRHLWTCEMRIPYAPMGAAAPSIGEEWRLNFFRSEGLGKERRSLAWSSIPQGDTFHVPARFGRLRFVQ